MKFVFIIALSTIATKKSGKAFASHKDSLKTKGSHHHGDYEGPDEEGYYKFIEAKTARPPQVRPPPYFKSSLPCEGTEKPFVAGTSHGNLCGDLNSGIIPTNPFHQSFDGDPYPFEQVTTSTLQFFSKTLPILQKDETVPKVINYNREEMKYFTSAREPLKEVPKRVKRQDKTTLESALMALKDFLLESTDILNITRRARKFCENGNGMVCLLYKAIQGEPLGVTAEERKDDGSMLHEMANGIEGPPTPCPAKVEYATPVFARNYQGIWRYVVQIPYEGYFTQTVEITTCLGPRCHYLEGKCLSSPRWMSLLVAEIFYPGGLKDTPKRQETDPYVFENVTLKTEEERCDGVDKNGCYQVRLYYDWFLVPGSCKCWKPDYLHKFTN